MSLWSGRPFLAVRVFGRDGQYPSYAIRTPGHAYVPSPELVWSAVVQPALPEDWEVGEFTPLTPEEVRLLSALALSERDPWENPWPHLTNFYTRHVQLPADAADLSDDRLFESAREIAQSIGAGTLGPFNRERVAYEVGDRGSESDALDLLQNIDSSDQLLLAGLARLLGATRLLSLHEPEEASIVLFISMGAALEFIRLHLSGNSGGADVAFSQVYEYLRQTFPDGDDVAEYYQLRYDERIMATHPSNRMGEFWAPPLMMSDVYHLRKSLMSLYRHLLLGETS